MLKRFRAALPLVLFSIALPLAGLWPNGDLRGADTATAEVASAEQGETGGHAEGQTKASPLAWSADLGLFSLVVFVVFLLVLTKLAWKPAANGLDARERRIRDDIEGAEVARQKSERMLEEHAAKLDRVQDEVKVILAEARRDADVARQNIVASAQSEAEATKNRAVSEIGRARDQALSELFETMSQGVVEATEHVLGNGLDDATQQRLIDEALNRFSDREMVAS